MKKIALLSASLLGLSLAAAPIALADDAETIKNAEMAAPAAVAMAATIYAPQADGSLKTLREGSNGFWCVPDDPSTPTNDPMCGDANVMEWLKAYLSHTEPPAGKVGFSYMLAGATTASNTDPYATTPAEGMDWIKDGPHVMVMNAPELMALYPANATPDTSQPYVMFGGTPYAHLMIPVQ